MIEIRDLRVAYGRTLALDAITLDLAPGIAGLFGPNGAGKSTLLRALAGLLRPDHGSMTLDDDALDIRNEDLRRRISYAGHETGLYRHLTVRENLELFASLYGVGRPRVDDMIEQVGLGDRANDQVGSLSAGLAKRAAVARALLHEPDLLLLDEPYANLDEEACELVSAALIEWRGPGRHALVATHGAKRVKAFADASIILQRGAIVSHRVRVPEGVQA